MYLITGLWNYKSLNRICCLCKDNILATHRCEKHNNIFLFLETDNYCIFNEILPRATDDKAFYGEENLLNHIAYLLTISNLVITKGITVPFYQLYSNWKKC